MTRHERVNIAQACRLYDRLRTWPAVARIMRRRDGSKFQTQSIMKAVRSQDRTVAVTSTHGNTP